MEACDSPTIFDDELKEIVGKTILNYLSNTKIIEDLINEYKNLNSSKDYKMDIAEKQKQIQALEQEKSSATNYLIKNIIIESDYKKQVERIKNEINKIQNDINILESNNSDITNNNKFIEKVKQKALEKIKYETADIDSLIYEFLDRVEVYHTNDRNHIKIKVILNTGNEFSINFKHGERPFCSDVAYDKSRRRINL